MPAPGGPADAIAAYKGNLNYHWLRGRLFGSAVQLIYALIAFLGFLSWFRNRKQRVLLWMSVWASSLLLAAFFARSPLAHYVLLSLTASLSPFSPLQTSPSGICCCIS